MYEALTLGSETRHLLPKGYRKSSWFGEKTADVYAHGIGTQGREVAINVAIVESKSDDTDAESYWVVQSYKARPCDRDITAGQAKEGGRAQQKA